MTVTDATRHRELLRTRIISALTAGILIFPLWLVLDRSPPFIVDNGRIDPPNPMMNSSIVVTWDIKATRSCQPSSGAAVTRTIIDSKGIRHNYAPVHAVYGTPEQREADEIQRRIPLPENITGPAKYTSIACYACNPLQELWPICIQMPEVPFEIQPARDGT
ncbi:MAG: hypothetical protein JWP25_8978 [Bradyrhizobium sp.]|nr:hypothetical protein [Bradyrhizobium sp.]